MSEEKRFSPLGIGRGTRVADRFEIERMLGSGAMSAVYKAYDKMLGNQICALKILAPKLAADVRDIDRFQNEVLITRKLTHEGIVRSFEFGKTDTGLLFVAMELVDGRSLEEVLDQNGRRGFPAAEALKILIEMLNPLSYAHSHGVLHRDIKPANVLVETGGRVKIADFGLAKTAEFQQGLTQAGEAIGSPAYMSPEQIRGLELDSRSDLYSAGVLLYELVAGRPPFSAASWIELGTSICKDPVPRISLSTRNSADKALDPFFAKALAKKPAERFQSAAEMAEEAAKVLGHFHSGQKTTLMPSLANAAEIFEESVIRWKVPIAGALLIASIMSLVGTAAEEPARQLETKVSAGNSVLQNLSTSVKELTAVAIKAHENREKISSFIRQQQENNKEKAEEASNDQKNGEATEVKTEVDENKDAASSSASAKIQTEDTSAPISSATISK